MRLTALFCASLLAFLLAPTAWAGGEIVEQPAGQTSAAWQHQVCRAGVPGVGGGRLPVTKKAVNYISGVMPGTQADVGKTFAAFVAEKYGVTVTSSECQTVRDEAAGHALIDQTWTALPTNAYYEDVKTGWTPGPAAHTRTQPASAETSETIAYDCDVGSGKGGFSITATYYYASGKRTADRATVTLDGNTTEMKRDSGDASGLSFGAPNGMGISKFQSGAHFYRGSTASNCVARVAVSPTPPTQSSPTTTAHNATPKVTSPPPTVEPQQAKAVYVICRADSSPGEPHFYNPPVDGGGGSYATWQPAYQSYLVETHHFRGSGVGCGYYPTAAAAQVDFDQWVANARHDSTIPGLTFKVILTDWKFK